MGKNTRLRLVFSPTLLSCSTASCVLYNGTEHSQGFFICSTMNLREINLNMYFKQKIGSMTLKDLDISSKCIAISILLKYSWFVICKSRSFRSFWYMISNNVSLYFVFLRVYLFYLLPSFFSTYIYIKLRCFEPTGMPRARRIQKALQLMKVFDRNVYFY